jgi:DNA-binding NarL/FixJ family response regulator
VVLVDDHVLMRQGLCALLRGEQGVRVVAQAGTPAGATAAVMRHQSAVVILDIRLGDDQDEGLRLCRELIEAAPGIRILVLTDELTGSLMRAALHAGAHGVLLKSSDFASLRRAIVDLDAGRNAFDHKTAAIVVGLLRSERTAPMITRRERDILALVARGLTNRAIGEKLAIRDTTVKFHLSNVMRKTGTSSRAGAVFKAGQLGLI